MVLNGKNRGMLIAREGEEIVCPKGTVCGRLTRDADDQIIDGDFTACESSSSHADQRVKGGVEARHLRKPGKVLLCEADHRQSSWRMQRREGGSSFKLPYDRIINEAMLPELRSAMHDSMPDGGRCRHFGVGKKSSDANDRFLLAGNGYCLGEQRIFVRILRAEFTLFVTDRLRLAGEQHFGP